MTPILVDQIKNHPKYQELTTKRTRFAWTLSIIMLVVYYTFIMTIAFSPESLAIPIFSAYAINSLNTDLLILKLLSKSSKDSYFPSSTRW